MKPPSLKIVAKLGVPIVAAVTAYCSIVYHLEPVQVGMNWNWVSGSLWVETRPGYHWDWPWTWTARIDTRPTQVCVTSAAHAAVSCKLVQFDPAFADEFLRVEGWWYYWWANRISFNSGYNQEYRGVRDVLRGYAFSKQPYPFIKVLREYEGEE